MSGEYGKNYYEASSSWQAPSSSAWNHSRGQNSQGWRDYEQSWMADSGRSSSATDQMPQTDPPNSRKRDRSDRSDSLEPDDRGAARFRVTEITTGPMNPEGNRLHDDVTWIEQEDDRAVGPPRTQAM